MRSTSLVLWTGLLLLSKIHARDPRHVGGREAAERVGTPDFGIGTEPLNAPRHFRRAAQTLIPQNANTTKFIVNGTNIPEVTFDIGESYAGLLPIPSSGDLTSELYFWFFPTANPDGKDEITIWLNGGPGCSSLEGLLQENGPFLWNYGTFRPVSNPWSWHLLTNMLYVEQPVGTGFSRGLGTELTGEDVAKSFLGFLQNFIDTFGLQNKKIYITGESFAGMYVPYIADAMFATKDKTHFDVRGTMIYDPSINTDTALAAMPAVPFVLANDNIFRLNDTFMADIKGRAASCGFNDFLNKHFQFPPSGPMPSPPRGTTRDCVRIWQDIKVAAQVVNPCFNMYHIQTTCPLLWDVLGFPGSFEYLPAGASIYFNRPDVKKAINAPLDSEWAECQNIALKQDASPPSSFTVLPRVIEKSERTIIAHGSLDFILIANGTLLTIQNMTWHGAQGFQRKPADDFFVPYHRSAGLSTVAGSGVQGVTHTERGLTWVEVFTSGHMVPQYAPAVAFRHLEYLLGRIPSLTETTPFTTQPGVQQPLNNHSVAIEREYTFGVS